MLAIGVLSCALLSQPARAQTPIQGTIQFGGAALFDTNSLATATRVNVWFDDQSNPGHSTVEPGNTGVFAAIPSGTQADMAQPWIFNPSTPTPHLWSVAGFTFDLLSSTIVTQNASFLNISGTGIVSGPPGFDPTNMDWAFSTQSAGGGTGTIFSFSANGVAVPEPAASALTLLGFALTGMEVWRRKLRNRSE